LPVSFLTHGSRVAYPKSHSLPVSSNPIHYAQSLKGRLFQSYISKHLQFLIFKTQNQKITGWQSTGAILSQNGPRAPGEIISVQTGEFAGIGTNVSVL
jgi:hypothetical protein